MAEPILRKSDESAYTIIPSRLSTKFSGRNSHTSDGSDEMVYRHLSFEDDLFTARSTREIIGILRFDQYSRYTTMAMRLKGKTYYPGRLLALRLNMGK